jgi:hypothetical protein
MNEVIDLARQKKMPIRVNRGQEINFSINVDDAEGDSYDFTDHTAELLVYNSFSKTDTPEFEIEVTLSSGLMSFYREAITRKKRDLVYQLWVTDATGYRQVWLNGEFIVLSEEVNHEDGEDTIIISPSGDNITLTLSLSSATEGVEIFPRRRGTTPEELFYSGQASLPSSGSRQLVVDTLLAHPFLVEEEWTFDKLSLCVSTLAAGSVRVALYADNGNLYPGEKVQGMDIDAISTATTGEKLVTFDEPITLSPGKYWMVTGSNVTAQVLAHALSEVHNWLGVAFSGTSAVRYTGYSVAYPFAALPDDFPSGATLLPGFNAPLVLLNSKE